MSATPPPPPPPPYRPPAHATAQPLEDFFVDIRGPLDATTADGWWWRLMEEFRPRMPFRTTVALGAVTSIDRTGIDALLSLAGAQAERGRPIWFADPPPEVRDALVAAGLGDRVIGEPSPS